MMGGVVFIDFLFWSSVDTLSISYILAIVYIYRGVQEGGQVAWRGGVVAQTASVSLWRIWQRTKLSAGGEDV